MKQREDCRRELDELHQPVPGRPVRRLNVNMPDDLYRQIKLRCAEEDQDISEMTRDLWIEYLNKLPSAKRRIWTGKYDHRKASEKTSKTTGHSS